MNINMFEQKIDEKEYKNYYYLRSSLIRALNQCIEEIKEKSISENIQFFDLDSHAELFTLPQTDLLGIKYFTAVNDSGVTNSSFYVVCSTMNDSNGIRLSQIVSYIYSRFSQGKAFKVINENLEKIGVLNIASGTEVIYTSKSDNRMVQYVDITGYLDIVSL